MDEDKLVELIADLSDEDDAKFSGSDLRDRAGTFAHAPTSGDSFSNLSLVLAPASGESSVSTHLNSNDVVVPPPPSVSATPQIPKRPPRPVSAAPQIPQTPPRPVSAAPQIPSPPPLPIYVTGRLPRIDEMPVASSEQTDDNNDSMVSGESSNSVMDKLVRYKDLKKKSICNVLAIVDHNFSKQHLVNKLTLDAVMGRPIDKNKIKKQKNLIQEKIKACRQLVDYYNEQIKELAYDFSLMGYSVDQYQNGDKLITSLIVPEHIRQQFPGMHVSSDNIEIESAISELLCHENESEETIFGLDDEENAYVYR